MFGRAAIRLGIGPHSSYIKVWRAWLLLFQKGKVRFFIELPFGRLRGNVRTSSIARWKARVRLPMHATAYTLITDQER